MIMLKYVAAYVGAGVTMAVIDAAWLITMMDRLYKPALGSLLKQPIDFVAAIAFYLIYIMGVTVLAIAPALREGGLGRALISGAVLGLVAYGTYDLTNQATLVGWSWRVTLIDIAWGTTLTAVTAAAGFLAARAVAKG